MFKKKKRRKKETVFYASDEFLGIYLVIFFASVLSAIFGAGNVLEVFQGERPLEELAPGVAFCLICSFVAYKTQKKIPR